MRRRLAAVLLLVPLLASCGSSPQAPGAATGGPATGDTAQGGAATTPTNFSFTPKKFPDKKVELDRPAERVVTDIYSAAALEPYGITPAGVWGFGKDGGGKGALDLSKQNVIGLEAEFSLEKLVAAKPDLIIGFSSDGSGWVWWDEKVKNEALKVAPYVPMGFSLMPEEMIAEYARLAQALGGTTTSPEVEAAEKRYHAALERIRKAAATKRDIAVLPMSVTPEGIWTGRNFGVTKLLTQAGVRIIGPEPTDGKPWAKSSWETIGDEKADLVLLHETSDRAQIESQKLYRQMPAVKAGQVGTWDDKRAYTYEAYATWLEDFAGHYEKAKDVVR